MDDVEVTADELWVAGLAAISDAEEFIAALQVPDDDLLVEDASTLALLHLARAVLVRHHPQPVCGLTACGHQMCGLWPCPLADLALRAVGALSRGVTAPTTTTTTTTGTDR